METIKDKLTKEEINFLTLDYKESMEIDVLDLIYNDRFVIKGLLEYCYPDVLGPELNTEERNKCIKELVELYFTPTNDRWTLWIISDMHDYARCFGDQLPRKEYQIINGISGKQGLNFNVKIYKEILDDIVTGSTKDKFFYTLPLGEQFSYLNFESQLNVMMRIRIEIPIDIEEVSFDDAFIIINEKFDIQINEDTDEEKIIYYYAWSTVFDGHNMFKDIVEKFLEMGG